MLMRERIAIILSSFICLVLIVLAMYYLIRHWKIRR